MIWPIAGHSISLWLPISRHHKPLVILSEPIKAYGPIYENEVDRHQSQLKALETT